MRKDRYSELTTVDRHAVNIWLQGRARGGDDEGSLCRWEVDGDLVEKGSVKRNVGLLVYARKKFI